MQKKRIDYSQFLSLPALILFSVFFVYPLLKGVGMSLTNWDGMGKASFVGFKNFIDFFADERAISDIRTTLIFAVGSAVLLNLVGLGYAVLMNSSFRGKSLARVIIYLPAIISPLIMGYIWYFLLQPGRGFLYHAFQQLGLPDLIGNWMSSYPSALAVLVLVNVWQFAGMTMIIYLAGLQSISGDVLEAALIDGATPWQRFYRVTLPLLMPAIRINVVTNIIGSLSVFDVIMSLTEGGPGYATESLSIYIMRMCYGSRTGYSTAVAMILFLIILVPVLISMRLTKSKA
ncbi:MAG: sugar ABC transporter permease [Oscillospiraceae bacterium]|jgi:raffinose/stachyose/melibiose transport system permease protein|nr:sugar ABC transporter permease [Oscillospiraceae bacterium]